MIICEMKDCVWYSYHRSADPAYKHQCDNDEIEIGKNEVGNPECCSYEKKEKP